MITKRQYLLNKECKKELWLSHHKNDEATPISDFQKLLSEESRKVKALAKQYFPKTFDCSTMSGRSADITKRALDDGHSILMNAFFQKNDLCCEVDLLTKENDEYSIYEVKAAKEWKKEFLSEAIFAKHVLSLCGMNIKRVYAMYINKNYVRNGDIDVHDFFTVKDITNEVDEIPNGQITREIDEMRNVLAKTNEISVPFAKTCKECQFHDYCTRNLPKDNITTINNIDSGKAYSLINQGIITVGNYLNQGCVFSKLRQKVQADCIVSGRKTPIYDVKEIQGFLNKIFYPVCFLDFETMNEAIPPFNNAHPFEMIPFQYSLFVKMSEDTKLYYKEYLGDKLDCAYDLAKRLIEDIPENATIIAYHSSTEKGIITKLAEKYPDLHDELTKRTKHIVDLLDPFKEGYYYHPKQGKDNSIKVVMPALCPKMADAYSKLPCVHKGDQASAMFPKMFMMGEKEYKETREGMLEYCKLDSLSMVEILKVLYRICRKGKKPSPRKKKTIA